MLEEATLETLEKVGRTRTVPGQIALLLARRLDDNPGDTGSSVAAVAKELKATMSAALEGAAEAPDALDVIRARRVVRLADSGGIPDYAGRGWVDRG